jgi:hypothetical protein
LLLAGAPALAQEGDPSPTVEALQERIRKLEERLGMEPAAGDVAEDAAEGEDGEIFQAEVDEPAEPSSADDYDLDGGGTEGDGPRELLSFELAKSVKVAIGGRLRLRGETRDPATYVEPTLSNDPSDSQLFALQRTRLHLAFDVLKHLRARVELQDSRLWGETGLAADVSDTHLYQGYVELYDLFDAPLSVKGGRFEVPTLGEGRLFSGLDWSNVARRVDGAMVGWGGDAVVAHGMFWVLDEADPATKLDANDDVLGGVYASIRAIEDHEIDLFVIWRHLNDGFTSEDGLDGDREEWTVGSRVKGSIGPFWYGAEGAVQVGKQARDEVLSWAGLVQLGLKIPLSDEMKFGLHTELAYARGDQDPTDGNVETFDPLLPFGHKYHGHIDLMSWRNMYGYKLGLAFWPMKWLSFHADGHAFWLVERKDAWYGATKAAIRQDPTGASGRYVGWELDLFVKAKVLEERVAIWAGYSHFFPGTFVRNTGRSFGMDWGFAQVEVFF